MNNFKGDFLYFKFLHPQIPEFKRLYLRQIKSYLNIGIRLVLSSRVTTISWFLRLMAMDQNTICVQKPTCKKYDKAKNALRESFCICLGCEKTGQRITVFLKSWRMGMRRGRFTRDVCYNVALPWAMYGVEESSREVGVTTSPITSPPPFNQRWKYSDSYFWPTLKVCKTWKIHVNQTKEVARTYIFIFSVGRDLVSKSFKVLA